MYGVCVCGRVPYWHGDPAPYRTEVRYGAGPPMGKGSLDGWAGEDAVFGLSLIHISEPTRPY